MSSAPADLQLEVDELKEKVRELSKTPEEREEDRRERYYAARAKEPAQETAAMSFVKHEREQRRQEAERWLTAWGVSSDASNELKSVVLNLRCECSQAAVIGLVAACAGEHLDRSKPTGRQMVQMFPKLAPDVQKAVAQAATAYSHLRNQIRPIE